MSRSICFMLCSVILVFSSAVVHSQPGKTALVGGTVYPVSAPPIENGVVLIRGDTIEAVGAGLSVPRDYQRIDVTGKFVFPGLINAYTNLGLHEYGRLVPSTVDIDETTDPVTPELRVTDAFHLDSRNIPVVRKYGVTNVLVTPGQDNVFAGQSAVVSLGYGLLADVVVESPVASHINLGEPPRSTYGSNNKMPMTRMGTAALIRQTLIDAKEYHEKKQQDPSTATDYKLESLVPVVQGNLPVIIRAQRLDDILTAIRLTEEFQLKTILSQGANAYKVADQLAAADIPVLLGPVPTQPTSMETAGAIYENAALLSRAAVRFALVTGRAQQAGSPFAGGQAGQLPSHAGIAAAYGLDPMEALKAITLYPAQILGIADRYGSLEPGKVADVVVAEGLILQPRANVTHVFIRGERIDLDTWQEELYRQFAPRRTTTTSSGS